MWTSDQVRVFLEFVADHRLGPLFTLAAMTGMRRGELLGLDWDDIDFAEATVIVRRSRVAVGYTVSTGTPKSGEGRLIDLDGRTVTVLRAWRKRQREERLAAGSGWIGSVFTDEFGHPLHPHAVFGYFERAVRDTGLPVLNFHGLRHSHATVLLRAGVPVRVVAERLGHADPAMTCAYTSTLCPACCARQQPERLSSSSVREWPPTVGDKPPSRPPPVVALAQMSRTNSSELALAQQIMT